MKRTSSSVASPNRRQAAQERVAIAYRMNGPFSLYRGVSPNEVTALAVAAKASRDDVRDYLRAHGHTCERHNPRRAAQMVDFIVSHLDGYAFVLQMDELRTVTALGTPSQRAAWLASITKSLRTLEQFRAKLVPRARPSAEQRQRRRPGKGSERKTTR